MKNIKLLLCLGFAFVLVFGSFDVQALADCRRSVDWNQLGLSKWQIRHMQKLDQEWYSLRSQIMPVIIKDQKKLKIALKDPSLPDSAIRKIYLDILLKRQHLNYEAMQTFLAKRRLLNKCQLSLLDEIIVDMNY